MSFRLHLPRAAALLLALAWPGAAGARAADSLSDVMDDFIDQLTESQREPLARELAEPRAECESDGEDDACRLVALRDYLLRSGTGGTRDGTVAPPTSR